MHKLKICNQMSNVQRWVYKSIYHQRNNVTDDPIFSDQTRPWTRNTIRQMQCRKRDRKPTLFSSLLERPNIHPTLSLPWLKWTTSSSTAFDYRRSIRDAWKWNNHLLSQNIFSFCKQTNSPREHARTQSTPVMFPVIELVTLGADTSLTAARGRTGSGCRQEKRK